MAKGRNETLINSAVLTNGLTAQNLDPDGEISDESTQEALDLLFANNGQTYEEFVSSFLYLNEDEITSPATTQSSSTTAAYINTSCPAEDGVTNCETPAQNYSDDLVQEVLGPGDHIASGTRRPSSSRLQLDNFVDDESLLGDDDNVNYCPTICDKMSGMKDSCTQSQPSCSSPLSHQGESSKNRMTLPGETEIHDTTKFVEVNFRSLNISTKLTKSCGSCPEDVSNSLCQEPIEDVSRLEYIAIFDKHDICFENSGSSFELYQECDHTWEEVGLQDTAIWLVYHPVCGTCLLWEFRSRAYLRNHKAAK